MKSEPPPRETMWMWLSAQHRMRLSNGVTSVSGAVLHSAEARPGLQPRGRRALPGGVGPSRSAVSVWLKNGVGPGLAFSAEGWN